MPTLSERFPFLAGVPVCDGLIPWSLQFLPASADFAETMEEFRAAGFTHVSLTAAMGREDAATALRNLGWLTGLARAAGIGIARTRDDIESHRAAGRLSVSFHFQTSTPFAASLDLVDAFAEAGIQRAILAYNEANLFADGCHEPRNAGLSSAGRALVRRMDAAGMIVDLSHCGIRTTEDVLAMSLSRPPIFSHSNARALFDHERNLTEAQIEMAARHGCYIGVNGVGMFLDAAGPDMPAAMARHLRHIADRIGAGNVGLGTDFMQLRGSDYAFYESNRAQWPNGYPDPPWSFFEARQLPDLIDALIAEKFTETEITGILGRNYLSRLLP